MEQFLRLQLKKRYWALCNQVLGFAPNSATYIKGGGNLFRKGAYTPALALSGELALAYTSDGFIAPIALGAKHLWCVAPSSKRQLNRPCRGLCWLCKPLAFQQSRSAKPQKCNELTYRYGNRYLPRHNNQPSIGVIRCRQQTRCPAV